MEEKQNQNPQVFIAIGITFLSQQVVAYRFNESLNFGVNYLIENTLTV